MESAGLPDSETKRIAIDNSTIAERHVVIAISCGYQPTTTWMILYRYEIIAINSSYRLVGGSIRGAGAGIIAINNRYAPSYVFSRETHLPTDVFPRGVHPNPPPRFIHAATYQKIRETGSPDVPFSILDTFSISWSMTRCYLSLFFFFNLSFFPSIHRATNNKYFPVCRNKNWFDDTLRKYNISMELNLDYWKRRRKFRKMRICKNRSTRDGQVTGTKLPRVCPNRLNNIHGFALYILVAIPFRPMHSISTDDGQLYFAWIYRPETASFARQNRRENIRREYESLRAGENLRDRNWINGFGARTWRPQACETDALSVICDRYTRGRIVINITGE